MQLDEAHVAMIRKTQQFLAERASYDAKMLANYEGRQTLAHLGLAIPPDLHILELVVNWPRVVVDTIEERQDVQSVIVPDDKDAANLLWRIMDANDLDSELTLWKRDRLVYGRGFLSVGVNEEPSGLPIIQVESPREIAVKIDRRHRRVAYAVRLTEPDSYGRPTAATIYEPYQTVTARRGRDSWELIDINTHQLGTVPIIPSFNRRMTGEWVGHSEMEDVIGITEAAVRTLTNLQAAVEVAALPKRIIAGAKKTDFESLEGWYNYLQPFLALQDAGAKVFQLDAADLKNFHSTVELYGKLAASVTGFPARYFGLITTNPPAEGAIRAEESKVVKRTERVDSESGSALSEALRLAASLAGTEIPRGMVNIRWHDPATPTFSQKADALQKLAGGKPLLSREGVWDELGWDEARKAIERERLQNEMLDELFAQQAGGLDEPVSTGPTNDASPL